MSHNFIIVIFAVAIAVERVSSITPCKTDSDCVGVDVKCIPTEDGTKKCGYLLTNLARGKPTYQTGVAYDGVSSRAVDGNTNTDWFAAYSCTCTLNTNGAWWSVDLGQSYTIDHVTVYGRTDCVPERLREVQLLVSTDNANYVQQGYHAGTLSPSYTFQMQSPVNGRWVKITRSSNVAFAVDDYLTLCEVQVFGHSKDEDECNTPGVCNHGTCSNIPGSFSCTCNDGWTGKYCETNVCANTACEECPYGYIHKDDGTCCGQCECPKECPKPPCRRRIQFQEEGYMCCPECMCRKNGGHVKPGPVGDKCDGCVCTNGDITCKPVQCMNVTKVECVDPVKGEDCCYTCPNGETCRRGNDVIVKGQTRVYGQEACMCAPYWYPNAFCAKKAVGASTFKGVENYKGIVAAWFLPEQ